MSPGTMTNQMGLDHSEESLPLQPWSVETYADSLMDELFEEVDQILGGNNPAPASKPAIATPTLAHSPTSDMLQSLGLPGAVLSSAIVHQPGLSLQARGGALEPVTVGAISPIPEPSGGRHRPWKLLLIGTACVSLAAAVGLWIGSQGGWQQFLVSRPQPAAPAIVAAQDTLTKAEADARFAQYLQRSLELIDHNTATQRQLTATPGATTAATLPTVPVPANPGQTPNRVSPVLERVYIPVYQPPQSLAPLANGALPTVPVPGMPVASAPAAPLPMAPAPVAVAPLPTLAPVANHTLLGILELGNRSAALLETNGVAQRVHVGESIGSSGWTLVQIANQEAIIRRNGEVRSVYVGQKF